MEGTERKTKSVTEVAEFFGVDEDTVQRMVRLHVLTDVDQEGEPFIDIAEWGEAGKRGSPPHATEPPEEADYRPSPEDLSRLLDQADPRVAPLRHPITEDAVFWEGCEILTGPAHRQLSELEVVLERMEALLQKAHAALGGMGVWRDQARELVRLAKYHLLEGQVTEEGFSTLQEAEMREGPGSPYAEAWAELNQGIEEHLTGEGAVAEAARILEEIADQENIAQGKYAPRPLPKKEHAD